MMSVHPIRTSEAVAEAYYGYLETTYAFADARLREQFETELRRKGKFVRGPVVQAAPPFKKTVTLRDLVDEGVLSELFTRYPAAVVDRLFYKHQEAAVRKMVSGRRNIVVATGTGSGKTECFMIPICNYLLRQQEAGTLGPGVRALLLYPMNALANDQVKRLRELFEPFPDITFGRYTGETLETRNDALDVYRNTFKYDPLPNEMICREEMRTSPPNILVTNYAMLEYLLLRPKDNSFFDGRYADEWRFLVLDEAHTYSGVKGIETAMLLRRLKDRVVRKSSAKLQCVATSATLGRGIEDAQQIMEFASNLFSEDFEYRVDDPGRQDLILAERELAGRETIWGKPNPLLYSVWIDAISSQDEETALPQMVETGYLYGVPERVLTDALARSQSSLNRFLYGVLSGDGHVVRAQEFLAEEPRTIMELGEELFDPGTTSDDIETNVISLIGLAVRARLSEGSTPLLPARYHLMLRALGGAWLSFVPQPTIYLDPISEVSYGDGHGLAYETGVCQRCGAAYILGKKEASSSGAGQRLTPTSSNDAQASYYAVVDPDTKLEGGVDEDEEPLPWDVWDLLHELCPICGDIRHVDAIGLSCSCEVERIKLLETKSNTRMVSRCLVCGGQNTKHGIVRGVSAYPEAAASVISTALYQELHIDAEGNIVLPELHGSEAEYDADGWPKDDVRLGDLSVEPKKLLVFSDSRQDAAYFAPYMQSTYDRMLQRNIILAAAREAIDELEDLPVKVPDLWRRAELALRPVLRLEGKSDYDARIAAQTCVLVEFRGRGRYGLENLGLLAFELERPDHWQVPPYYASTWGLTEREVWDLYNVLLNTVRESGAISVPKGVNAEDELFEPGNLRASIRKARPDRPDIKAWIPSRPSILNRRSDYLVRLAQRIGLPGDLNEIALEVLSNIWEKDLRPHSPRSRWNGYFDPIHDRRKGITYRLVPGKWNVLAYGSKRQPLWYACDKCGRLTLRNIRGVCPQYRCPGTLQPVDIAKQLAANHYVRLYVNENFPKQMRAQEHTAQLTPIAAARSQMDFQEGRINILSCSTTFELGVDLGDLEVVLMKNVPPSPANYVQRAGRAGRRSSTAAMVVTYAQDRPHDSFHYRHPDRMIKGHIKPPHFDLSNEKIVLRHVYAVALADFWRNHEDHLGRVENLFLRDDGSGVDDLAAYLATKPRAIQASLEEVVPAELEESLGVQSWAWVDRLLAPIESPEPGPLTLARIEVESDIAALTERYDQLVAIRRTGADHLVRLMNTIKKRNLINFLSSRNVLPRYGFPVDVVMLDLRFNHHADRDIELQRELSLAISDYAPDGETVAGGKIWVSRYLQSMPQRHWPRYHFGECTICRNHVTKLHVGDGDKTVACGTCGAIVKCEGSFLVPEFGFLADLKEPKAAGSQRPKRTYSTRVFFSGVEADSSNRDRRFELPGGYVTVRTSKAGRLAVINGAKGAQFLICQSCGYGMIAGSKRGNPGHNNAYGRPCQGRWIRAALGHEFRSDIAKIEFEPCTYESSGFWYSLLYALIEGACMAMDVHRTEIDGCIQWGRFPDMATSLILFDSVPGGVGHVQQLATEVGIKGAINAAYARMQSCTCGGETGNGSCYRCLRNYTNQFCHDVLDRGLVKDFLERLCLAKDSPSLVG
ncbi:MAG: DEAD/DEAH box helicase [Firmicutes bacterium]|nr:DEAD/DEAH box helicase [Bacillota bacterium]